MECLVDSHYENDYCLLVITAKPVEQPLNTPEPNRVTSDVLLGPRKELVILHNGREYRLRITQSGKLILTA